MAAELKPSEAICSGRHATSTQSHEEHDDCQNEQTRRRNEQDAFRPAKSNGRTLQPATDRLLSVQGFGLATLSDLQAFVRTLPDPNSKFCAALKVRDAADRHIGGAPIRLASTGRGRRWPAHKTNREWRSLLRGRSRCMELVPTRKQGRTNDYPQQAAECKSARRLMPRPRE